MNRSLDIWALALLLVATAIIVASSMYGPGVIFAQAGSADGWLGFWGGVVGGLFTVGAAVAAWVAAFKGIDHSKRQAAIERLLTSRSVLMRLNSLRQIALDMANNNPGHPEILTANKTVADYVMSLEVIAAYNDPFLRGDVRAIEFFSTCTRGSVINIAGNPKIKTRMRAVANELFYEIDKAIETQIDSIDRGEELKVIALKSNIDLTQYHQHMVDGSPIDISHVRKIFKEYRMIFPDDEEPVASNS